MASSLDEEIQINAVSVLVMHQYIYGERETVMGVSIVAFCLVKVVPVSVTAI